MEWTPELVKRFMSTDPATYGHFHGVSFMMPRIKPVSRSMKMIGPAYTARILGKDSCAMYKAIQEAPGGSVLVIDRAGDEVFACVGEMVARNARALGLAGIVIDGPATDSVWIDRMGFPVFCAGISVATTNVWGLSGQYDIPVNCGGAVVHPGDIVFGDADGVIVMPPDNSEAYLAKAEAATVREAKMREDFADGKISLRSVDPLIEANMEQIVADIRSGTKKM